MDTGRDKNNQLEKELEMKPLNALTTALLATFAFADNAFAVDYKVIDLGTLGGPYSYAYGIDDQGRIVGEAWTPGDVRHAYRYANGSMYDLGIPATPQSSANAINASGQITGRIGLDGFLYDNGTLTLLGSLGGAGGSEGRDINDNGLIAGSSDNGTGYHAVLYDNGTLTDLGTLGGISSFATGINNAGQVTGVAQNGSGISRAFLYTNGSMTDIGTLGGATGAGRAINNSGAIVGYAAVAGGEEHAFLYENGAMIDLGTLGGHYSQASAINDKGQVVGLSYLDPDVAHAFLYTKEGGLLDLNSLLAPDSGWVLAEGMGINELGQIVGYGFHHGALRGFLLTAVPIPASAWLFGFALAGLNGLRRLRR